jgi:hypothetical protein
MLVDESKHEAVRLISEGESRADYYSEDEIHEIT